MTRPSVRDGIACCGCPHAAPTTRRTTSSTPRPAASPNNWSSRRGGSLKAIAIGLTYAAEQDLHQASDDSEGLADEWTNTAYRTQDRTLLDLRLSAENTADSLTNLLLAAPFSGLAKLVDPMLLGSATGGGRLDSRGSSS